MKRSALPDRPRLFGRFPNIGPDLPGGRIGFVWGDRRSWEADVMLIDGVWLWRFWTTWTDVAGCTVEMRSLESFECSKSEFSRALRRIHRSFDSAVNGARRGQTKRNPQG